MKTAAAIKFRQRFPWDLAVVLVFIFFLFFWVRQEFRSVRRSGFEGASGVADAIMSLAGFVLRNLNPAPIPSRTLTDVSEMGGVQENS
jgi:hypothetical protein